MAPRTEGGVIKAAEFRFRAKARLQRELDQRRPDVEIRHLHALVQAYSNAPAPEVMVVGDSAMFWVSPTDPDTRTLAAMLPEYLPGSPTLHALAGPGYNPRIITVFLEALRTAPHRPKVILLPISVLMATTAWSNHPQFGYQREAPALTALLREGQGDKRHLPRATHEDWERWDRLPAPSLIGARRTLGEHRLLTEGLTRGKWAPPLTTWQKTVRMKAMLDLYNAEELTADSAGVKLVEEMSAAVSALGVPAVGYIAPVNYRLAAKALGEQAIERIKANGEAISAAFLSPGADQRAVCNALFLCEPDAYGDPVHLNSVGRPALAQALGAAAAPFL